ncbi:Uncharacterized protein APZ42_024618 [Daphnia magna]|uniref:Uncharacterized protein n=1 Tax=Daphnia magna TaxID=35525 RepID=A0A164TWB9_9CRUS|nr:Uncharacterized protein APZ42_024618 [Daphnia magna]
MISNLGRYEKCQWHEALYIPVLKRNETKVMFSPSRFLLRRMRSVGCYV